MIHKVYTNPDIYCIHVSLPDNPLQYLHLYILPRTKRTLVIDTGVKRLECRKALKDGLQELSIELKTNQICF